MATKKQKKSTKGIPRVTAAVIAMTAEAQQAWIDGLKIVGSENPLTDAQKDEIRARLTKAVSTPRKGKKVMDWNAAVKGRSTEELSAALAIVKAALVGSKVQIEQDIADLAARIEQRKAALAAVVSTETVSA